MVPLTRGLASKAFLVHIQKRQWDTRNVTSFNIQKSTNVKQYQSYLLVKYNTKLSFLIKEEEKAGTKCQL